MAELAEEQAASEEAVLEEVARGVRRVHFFGETDPKEKTETKVNEAVEEEEVASEETDLKGPMVKEVASESIVEAVEENAEGTVAEGDSNTKEKDP